VYIKNDYRHRHIYPGFYNGRVHVVGAGPRDLGDRNPPEAEAKCECTIFNVFLYKILHLMNIRAGLGQ